MSNAAVTADEMSIKGRSLLHLAATSRVTALKISSRAGKLRLVSFKGGLFGAIAVHDARATETIKPRLLRLSRRTAISLETVGATGRSMANFSRTKVRSRRITGSGRAETPIAVTIVREGRRRGETPACSGVALRRRLRATQVRNPIVVKSAIAVRATLVLSGAVAYFYRSFFRTAAAAIGAVAVHSRCRHLPLEKSGVVGPIHAVRSRAIAIARRVVQGGRKSRRVTVCNCFQVGGLICGGDGRRKEARRRGRAGLPTASSGANGRPSGRVVAHIKATLIA